MTRRAPSYTFDADLELINAVLTASAAGTVEGFTKVVRLGDAVFSGTVVLDIDEIELSSNDELYTAIVQGSTVEAFTAGTIQNLAELSLGATEVRPGAAKDSTVGRHLLPFCNIQAGTVYEWCRAYVAISGSITTGIGLRAFIGKTRAA
jgi:hypothetical protein